MRDDRYWQSAELRPAFRLARETTRHWAKSFYLATGLLPEPKRWATYALYGFCRFADNLVDNPRAARSNDELLAEVRALGDEVTIAFRTGESEHPVVKPVIAAAQAHAIPAEPLLDLLRGIAMDLDVDRYETFHDLYVFCYRVAGTVGLMMSPVLGYDEPEAECYAEALGVAMQLTNILRDVAEDARRGRIYLPLEDLERFGVTEEEILRGEMSDRLAELMRFEIARARHFYDLGTQGIPLLHPDARFAIRAAARIYGAILDQLEAQDGNPFVGRAHVSKSGKLRLLGREWITEKFGRRFTPPTLPNGHVPSHVLPAPSRMVSSTDRRLDLPREAAITLD